MLAKIKKLFIREPLPPKVAVQLTPEQMKDMVQYDVFPAVPIPEGLKKGSVAYFIGKENTPVAAVVQAIKKQGTEISYRVLYNVKSEKTLHSGELFKTKQDALNAAVREHWRSIHRLYAGLLKACTATQEVINYTIGKVQAHKEVITFLQSQIEEETING